MWCFVPIAGVVISGSPVGTVAGAVVKIICGAATNNKFPFFLNHWNTKIINHFSIFDTKLSNISNMELKTLMFMQYYWQTQQSSSWSKKNFVFNNFCRTQEGPAYMRLSRFRPSVRPYVRTYVRLHIRFQFYPTRSIYVGPPIFLQIPDLLCIDY